ncbi:MAG: site-2 protease family protein [Muribaculaceae bacterium]|nr:site-2 protease family protein [Muribaculaceae bacterium]
METILIKGLQLILALTLLVTIHEFGHFIFARIFGMRADRFYLFFNPWFSIVRYDPRTKKWSFFKRNMTEQENFDRSETVKKDTETNGKSTWRDTIYGIGWLPLGGYVSIGGMIDENMDETQKQQMELPPHPTDFRAKAAWKRLLVMAGGVLFNFLLAIAIYIGIAYHWGEKYIPYENAYEGMDYVEAAHEVGFRNGDIPYMADGELLDAKENGVLMKMAEAKEVTVLRRNNDKSVDTVKIAIPEKFLLTISEAGAFMGYRLPVIVKEVMPGEPAADAGLMADDRIIAMGDSLTPSYTEFAQAIKAYADQDVALTVVRDSAEVMLTAHPTPEGKLGFQFKPLTEVYDVEVIKYGLLQSVPKGISDGVGQLTNYVSSLKYVFTKEGAQSVGGFAAIGNMFSGKWSWLSFWEITAFLSVILAFMNALPIPALDGGHIVFALWEVVTRRKPALKVLIYSQYVGMLLLITLLLYANANDIYRFLIK